MTKFALRSCRLLVTVLVVTLFVVAGLAVAPAGAANKLASGDGSGIGGTGNSPSGGGIGGTGTKEQNSPKTMPDLPDRPEAIERPDVEPPDLPSLDIGGGSLAEPPPSPPEIAPASPPEQ